MPPLVVSIPATLLLLLALAPPVAWCAEAAPAAAIEPEIRIADVELFYRIYDAAGGKPSGAVLQRDYIEAGSAGLRDFLAGRIVSGEKLAERIAAKRGVYESSRNCAAVLVNVKARIGAALRRLRELLPEASFPPVTILIGRATSAGTASPAGVLIGIETACAADHMQQKLDDRLVHLVVHEYAHVQQPRAMRTDVNDAANTVLALSLIEGGAELLTELVSGSVSNVHLQRWTAGREREIESAFARHMHGIDRSNWLYNGVGTPEQPGDLGYWVGYRIGKTFYERADDKRAALRRLLLVDDPEAILKESGWSPGAQ